MQELLLQDGVTKTQVDDADYSILITNGPWSLSNGKARGVVNLEGLRKRIMLHRFLLSPPEELEVDHIDGNPLNNQRSNLRLATRTENARNRRIGKNNTSGYKGVHFNKPTRKWIAQICFKGKAYHLGLFGSPHAAAAAYNNAAREHYGQFAKLNKIEV